MHCAFRTVGPRGRAEAGSGGPCGLDQCLSSLGRSVLFSVCCKSTEAATDRPGERCQREAMMDVCPPVGRMSCFLDLSYLVSL